MLYNKVRGIRTMKKIGKILVLLLLLGIFVGAGITVFINHKKEEKNESKKKTEINYKITRKNNKYNISNSEGKLLNKTISNIFYNGKIVYIFLSDEENTTLLKYELKTESVEVVYEENKELLGEIKKLGNNYIVWKSLYPLSSCTILLRISTIDIRFLLLDIIEFAQLFPIFTFPNPFKVLHATINCTSSACAVFEIMYRSTFNDISTLPALYLIHSYIFLHRLLFMIPFFQSS